MRLGIGVLLAVCFVGPPAAAQKISRADFIRQALDADPDLAQALESQEQARFKRNAAVGAWLPALSASADTNVYGHNPSQGYARDDGRFSWDRAGAKTSLSLNLFNSFKDWRGYNLARADWAASERRWTGEKLTAYLRAVEHYEDLRLSQALLGVAGDNSKISQDRLAVVRRLYEGGLRSLADLKKSETDAGKAELDLLRAESQAQLVLARFNLALRRPMEEAAQLEETEPSEPPWKDLGGALAFAYKTHPAL